MRQRDARAGVHALRIAPIGVALACALACALALSGYRWVPAQRAGTPPAHSEVVVLSGGCFWGVQWVYEHVRGVTEAVSGYAGGESNTASYEEVSTGSTGHAESVRITFDPIQVSFQQILQVFFTVAHDPTEANYQGPDEGPQYRSAIWYTSPEQKRAAEAYIAQLTAAKTFRRPIVTQVGPLRGFYPAEAYHQDYAEQHPNAAYIAFNDRPKIQHLRALLPALYRDTPVLTTAARNGR